MCIVGLSKCGFKKAFIASTSRLEENISSALQQMLPLMNPAQVASALSALAALSWRWESMRAALRLALTDAAAAVADASRSGAAGSLRDMSVCASSLGSLGVTWTELPAEARRALLRALHRVFSYGTARELAGE
jgi:hypothetical protein